MFKILLIGVLFFFMMFLLLGVSFLRGLKNLIFGSSNSRQQSRQRQQNQSQQSNRQQQYQQQQDNASRKKIFAKDEGEYVDYEEVKEEDKR